MNSLSKCYNTVYMFIYHLSDKQTPNVYKTAQMKQINQ